ncbi:hypothetical protein OFS25_23535 [Escherichia coli]|nr:hypothetical protein [Escherichia coli]
MKNILKDKKAGHYYMGQAIASVAYQSALGDVLTYMAAHDRELVASGYICSRLYVDNVKQANSKRNVGLCHTEQYLQEAYNFYIEGDLRSSVSPDQLWDFFMWFNSVTGFLTLTCPPLPAFSVPQSTAEWYSMQVMQIPEKARKHLIKEIEGAHGY